VQPICVDSAMNLVEAFIFVVKVGLWSVIQIILTAACCSLCKWHLCLAVRTCAHDRSQKHSCCKVINKVSGPRCDEQQDFTQSVTLIVSSAVSHLHSVQIESDDRTCDTQKQAHCLAQAAQRPVMGLGETYLALLLAAAALLQCVVSS
jgi:hypothetical protein